ncbi:unannotated protein [freshwater metagenome]|uniref:Unannotated protein n=1 Tax=freshwater metagenome TaxID=449393 RepID=A0A6J6I5Z1_9ZZZZ
MIALPSTASPSITTSNSTVADWPEANVPPVEAVAPLPRRAVIELLTTVALPTPLVTVGDPLTVVPPGNGSTSSTLVAGPDPLFVAVIV